MPPRLKINKPTKKSGPKTNSSLTSRPTTSMSVVNGTPGQGPENRRLENVHRRRNRRAGLVHGRRKGGLSILGEDEETGRQEPVRPQRIAAGLLQRKSLYAARPGEGSEGLARFEFH